MSAAYSHGRGEKDRLQLCVDVYVPLLHFVGACVDMTQDEKSLSYKRMNSAFDTPLPNWFAWILSSYSTISQHVVEKYRI
jgi:hypothetical protein